jgi:hypothetical protein
MKRLFHGFLLLFGITLFCTGAADPPCNDRVSIGFRLAPSKFYQPAGTSNTYNLLLTDSLVAEINQRRGETKRDFLRGISPKFSLLLQQTPAVAGCAPKTYKIDTVRVIASGFHFNAPSTETAQSVNVDITNQRRTTTDRLVFPLDKPIPFGGTSAQDQHREISRKLFLDQLIEEMLAEKVKKKQLVITFQVHMAVNLINAVPTEVKNSVTINILRVK